MITAITLNAQGLDASLYTFDFLPMGSFPVEQRAEHLTKLGYKGVTFRIGKEEDLDKLKQYLSTREVQSGNFSIPVVFFLLSINEAGIAKDHLWKQTLALSPETSIWVIIAA